MRRTIPNPNKIHPSTRRQVQLAQQRAEVRRETQSARASLYSPWI